MPKEPKNVYKCLQCNIKFWSKFNYERHSKLYHSDEVVPDHSYNSILKIFDQNIGIKKTYENWEYLTNVVHEHPRFKIRENDILLKYIGSTVNTSWEGAMKEVVEIIKENTPLHSYVVLRLSDYEGGAKGIGTHEANFSLRRVDDLSPEVLLERIERIQQSGKFLNLSNKCNIYIKVIQAKVGGRPTKIESFSSIKEAIIAKKTAKSLHTGDSNYLYNERNHDCFGKAIAISLNDLYIKKDLGNIILNDFCFIPIKNLHMDVNKTHTIKINNFTKYLYEAAKIPHGIVSSFDFKYFQKVLNILSVGIDIYDIKGYKMYSGDGDTSYDHIISLIFTEYGEIGHFDILTKPQVFFNTNKLCNNCSNIIYSRKKHICSAVCSSCKYPIRLHDSTIPQNIISCDICNFYFKNEQCFDFHKTLYNNEKKTLCESFWYCVDCNLRFNANSKKTHNCTFSCGNCFKKFTNKETQANHVCYMQPDSSKFVKRQDYDSLVIFDIESILSTVNDSLQNDVLKHEPVLIYAIYLCKKNCMNYASSNISISPDITLDPNCENELCGYHSFYGEFCIYDFLTFLFKNKNKKNTVVVSHNGSRYDMIFLVRAVANLRKQFTLLPVGNGILSMFVPEHKLKFVDSLCWLKLPLSKLPQAFNFQGEKGVFPYLFNINKIRVIVDLFLKKKYFNIKNMSYAERADFDKWYENEVLLYKNGNKHYNLQKEMEYYCFSDVEILLKAVLIFRSYLLNLFETDLLLYITLPHIANSIFRNKFMKNNTIAIIHDDYNPRKSNIKYSKIGIIWLKYMEKVYNLKIQTALSPNGEFKIHDPKMNKTFFVDGYDKQTNTVFEFQGCAWHFCNKCNKMDQTLDYNNLKRNAKKITFHDIYLQDQYRKHFFLSNGYIYKEIKECEFNYQMKHDIKLKLFIDNFDFAHPPKIRDALFGGRTEAFAAFCELNNFNKSEICYYDICSLYPYVLMSKRFPIGYPKIITENFNSIDSYFGLVQCRVLPPTNLYLPILPYRNEKDNKLYFGLCRLCIQNKKFDETCSHKDFDRSWVGFYTTPELQLACNHDYKILKIFEIWEFKETINDKENSKCDGVFGNYFKAFFKSKIESSGWVNLGVNSDDYNSINNFKNEVKNNLDISIDVENVKDNPAMRHISKLFLNSTWGRLSMNKKKRKQIKMFSKIEDVLQFWNSTKCEITDLIPLDEYVLILFKEDERFVKPASNLNIVISVFTTSYARIELYKLLKKTISLYFIVIQTHLSP